MIYSIFRNSILVVKVKPNDNSQLSQKKQQEDVIKLAFTLDEPVEFKIGDYISFEKTEQLYYLNTLPRVVESPKNNQYECIFEGAIHELRKTKVILTTPKTEGGEYIDYRFSLTGNAETFLQFLVDNLNRTGSEYIVGTFKETDIITMDFNNWNVFETIVQISDLLDFDWYLDGLTLNFDAKTIESSFTFQVGRLVGFTELIRIRLNSSFVQTVVYGYGSIDNLPPRTAEEGQTYDSPLLTENRLAFSGVDGESKLENNIALFGRVETIQEFDDIKPEYTGVVTSIDSEDVSIFFDTNIDFDINDQLLSGIKPKITFLTGKLIGLTFDISFDDDDKEITMDIYSDESGDYPNDIIFAEVDDEYKIFDLIMPESYITDAETRLEDAVQTYLDESSDILSFYEGNIDSQYIQTNQIVLNLGELIRVVSTSFLIDNLYEIKELIQNINDPNKYIVKFGDILPRSLLSLIKSTNFNTNNYIYQVSKSSVTTNQVINIIGERIEWNVIEPPEEEIF